MFQIKEARFVISRFESVRSIAEKDWLAGRSFGQGNPAKPTLDGQQTQCPLTRATLKSDLTEIQHNSSQQSRKVRMRDSRAQLRDVAEGSLKD